MTDPDLIGIGHILDANDRRFGEFHLSDKQLLREPSLVKQLFGQMLIFRAEYRFEMAGVDYVGLCDLFDSVPMNCAAPRYEVYYDGEQWKARKQSSF